MPEDWEDHVKLMFDLQVLALQADLTRVITFQMAREGSTRSYPQIGVPEPHHPISHHVNDPAKLEKLAKINAYHVSLFGYLLEKLRTTKTETGRCSTIPRTCWVAAWGTRTSTITRTCNRRVPGGLGSINEGRHITYDEHTPLANLHLSFLDHMGVELASFVDSTGRAGGVLEPLSL